MNIVYIYGAPAVGKRTVAKELANSLGYALFDNHADTSILTRFFTREDPAYWRMRKAIRTTVYQVASQENVNGMVLTGVHEKQDEESIEQLYKELSALGVLIHFVHLVCSEKERKVRVQAEDRKDKPLRTVESLRPNSDFVKMERDSLPSINITEVSPKVAASQIRILCEL